MATTATRTNYWFIKTTSNTSPAFNFKFVVEIYIDGSKKATLVQPKNNAGSAHFNLERVVKNYIKVTNKKTQPTPTGSPTITYDDVHLIPRNFPTVNADATINDYVHSDNEGTIKTVTLKFFEDYSAIAGGVISRNASGQADINIVYINYANDWHDQLTFDVSKFVFSTTTPDSKFLTTLPTVDYNNKRLYHDAGVGEFRTFAALNSIDLGVQSFAVDYKFYINKPLADYSNYRARLTYNFAAGAVTGAANDDKALQFFAAGYENVSKIRSLVQGGSFLIPSDNYYTVEAVNSTATMTGAAATELHIGDFVIIVTVGTTDYTLYGSPDNIIGTAFFVTSSPVLGTGTVLVAVYPARSKVYCFKINRDCNKYTSSKTTRTICWKNKYGAWDYHLFDTKITSSDKTKRSIEYTKNPGSWNSADYDINTFERGKVQKVEGVHSFTASTRFLNEAYNDYFRGLIMSNDIKMIIKKEVIEGQLDGENIQNEYVLPLIMTSNSLSYKTVLNDDLIQYNFDFELAHNLKQQV